jgi:thiamine biosynthesis lipoprotein
MERLAYQRDTLSGTPQEQGSSVSKIKVAIVSVVIIIMAGLFGTRAYNGRGLHIEKQTRFMMDTYVTISVVGPAKAASAAINLALDRMQQIDVKFNLLNPDSPVYAFNNVGTPITDPEIVSLVQTGLDVSRKSEGAFDMTVAPLAELWGFYSKSYRVPEAGEIAGCLGAVGFRHLSLSDGSLSKDNPAVKIDLGGIAKGYALAEAVRILKEHKVSSALVDCGGDIYAMGKKGKQFWKVGIRDPRGEDIIGYVEVEDLAVMGSGDYERFFMQDGKRYHHIFDPATGYPTEGVIGGVLIHPDPIIAQAWGKIPFVMGSEMGLKTMESIERMEVFIVTSSGEKLYSSRSGQPTRVVLKEQ